MTRLLRALLPAALGPALLALAVSLSGASAIAMPVPVAPIVIDGAEDALAPSFDEIDIDGDAALSAAELDAWFTVEEEADLVAFFDADGNGTVDRADFDALLFEPAL